MDYLSFLPIEIWKKILLELPIYRTIGAYQSDDPLLFSPADEFSWRNAAKLQKERVRLLFICKSLHPLVLELLYHEVLLVDEPRIGSFLVSATQPENHYFANATRTIRIQFVTPSKPHRSQISYTQQALKTACPNVVGLYIWDLTNKIKKTSIGVWKHWMDDWGKDLVDLNWSDTELQESILYTACRGITRPHALTIKGAWIREAYDLTLPTVRRLRLRFPAEGLKLPALEWLQINSTGNIFGDQFSSMITAHKQSLRGLDITGGLGYFLVSTDTLQETNVDTLLTTSSDVRRTRRAIHSDTIVVKMKSLTTIYVRIDGVNHLKGFGYTIAQLNDFLFPHLKYVILVIKGELNQSLLDALRIVILHLRDFVVTIRVDPYSSL